MHHQALGLEVPLISNATVDAVNSPSHDLYIRLVGYLRRNGWRGTVARAATLARQGLFQSRKCLFYCDLRSVSPPAPPKSLRVERLDSPEKLDEQAWQRIGMAWNLQLARRAFPQRFQRGALMWKILADGEFAGYGWTLAGDSISPYYHPLGKGDVHLFDFFVFPAFRGRQLSTFLLNEMSRELAAAGQVRALIDTSEWNHPMLNSLRKTDFRPFGVARKITLFGRTFVDWVRDETKAAPQAPR